MIFPEFEGLNGIYYSEDRDGHDDESGGFSRRRRKWKRKKSFRPDPLYYHCNLFHDDETPVVVFDTGQAILYRVIWRDGSRASFWVPKALIQQDTDGTLLVHRSFTRKYLKDEDKS